MPLVVRLQARDLANIRFSISPTAHLLLGAVPDSPYPAARRWWRQARRHAPAAAAEVVRLLQAKPMFTPDFLTPPIALDPRRPGPTIADELDAIRAVGQARVEEELSAYADLPYPPRVVSALLDGGRAMERLADSLYALYRACLAEQWPDIERRLRADLAYRAHAQLSQNDRYRELLARTGDETGLAALSDRAHALGATLTQSLQQAIAAGQTLALPPA